MKIQWKNLITCIAIPLAVGSLSALLILKTTILFYEISKPAGYLMVPYLLWVTFAGCLNFSIYLLN